MARRGGETEPRKTSTRAKANCSYQPNSDIHAHPNTLPSTHACSSPFFPAFFPSLSPSLSPSPSLSHPSSSLPSSSMEYSKPHLLLSTLLLLLLFHPQLTSPTCVQREYLHLIHALLPQPSSQQQQQPNPQPPPAGQQQQQQPQPTPADQPQQQQQPQPTPADQPQQPTPTSDSAQAAAGLDSASASLDTALAEPASNQQTANANAAIKDVCSKTDYPDLCITSLTGEPIQGDTLDPATALRFLIKSAVRHGNAALVEAKKLASDTTLPDFTLQNMKVCEDTYSSALDDFQKASEAAEAKDMGTLNTMLSAAMTDYETCSDGFMEMPGASPLIDYDDKLSHMTSNCLAVATLLK